jgi:hypothetical protein
MTDPTGLSFLSYRRSRAAEAKLLIEAQRDRGIPTWQDVTDLPNSPTEIELRRVLSDPATANAILFVTPEVEDSSIIRTIESPLILERHFQLDGFFALPVAAGGLDYADMDRVLGAKIGLAHLPGWNVHKVGLDPIDIQTASGIADRVLHQRLVAIHSGLPPGEPLRVQIGTRAPLAKRSGHALLVDLTHRFEGRVALPDAWERHILPSFDAMVRAIQLHGGGRQVTCDGFLAIPAALALGSAFLSLAGVRVTWMQDLGAFGENAEPWGLHLDRRPSGFRAETSPRNAAGYDTALLVSVTNDVVDDFNSVAGALDLRAVVHITPNRSDNDTSRLRLNAGEALDVAHLAVDSLRQAWATYKSRGTVHVFLATPVGLAFMIGQLLNTFANIQTYEYMPGRSPIYQPAAHFMPSH